MQITLRTDENYYELSVKKREKKKEAFGDGNTCREVIKKIKQNINLIISMIKVLIKNASKNQRSSEYQD